MSKAFLRLCFIQCMQGEEVDTATVAVLYFFVEAFVIGAPKITSCANALQNPEDCLSSEIAAACPVSCGTPLSCWLARFAGKEGQFAPRQVSHWQQKACPPSAAQLHVFNADRR